MVDITKVSTKGQIVIPQDIRDALGIKPGDTLQLERVNGLVVLKKVDLPSLKKELGGAKK